MVLGNTEIMLVVAVVLLLFGGSQIPRLARNLGRVRGEFLKSRAEFERELRAGEREQAGVAGFEQSIRRTARAMGVPEEGRSLEDVKRDLSARLT